MRLTGKKIALIAVILLTALFAVYGTTQPAQINFNTLAKQIASGNNAAVLKILQTVPVAKNEINDAIINWALANEEDINPLILFDISRRVFVTDKQEGMKWFFVAQMWSYYDARRCTDASAQNGIQSLSAFAPKVLKYTNENLDEVVLALKSAIAWEKDHPSLLLPTWICRRGMVGYQAAIEGKSLADDIIVIPENKWLEIRSELQRQWHDQVYKLQARIDSKNSLKKQPDQGVISSLLESTKERILSIPDKVLGYGKSYSGNGITATHTHTFNHTCPIFNVVWSPDGDLLTSSSPFCVEEIVWDIETYDQVMKTKKRYFDEGGIGFSLNGQHLITSEAIPSTKENQLAGTVWDIKTGKKVKNFKGHFELPQANNLKFIQPSFDGKYIVIAGNGSNALEIHDAQTYEYIRSLGVGNAMASCMAMQRHRPYVAVAEQNFDGYVQIIDYESGKLVKRFRAQTATVDAISYSPDGKYLATGAHVGYRTRNPKTMEWTELTDPDVIRVWKKHGEELAWSYFMGDSTGPVRGGLSFSPDGKYLAAAMDEKIYILDGRSDKVLLSIATSHSINAVAFNPNKNMLAVASDDNISMWRIDAKQNGL